MVINNLDLPYILIEWGGGISMERLDNIDGYYEWIGYNVSNRSLLVIFVIVFPNIDHIAPIVEIVRRVIRRRC